MTNLPTEPNPQDPLGINQDDSGMMGHNNPPEPLAYDPVAMAALQKTTDAFVAASNKWLPIEVNTEALAEQLTDQIDGLRKLYTQAEAERTEAKKPHLERGKAVDTAYSTIKAMIETSANLLKPKLAKYVEIKTKRLEAERQERIAEANRIEEAARLKRIEAENADTVESKVAADAAEKEAAKIVKAAAKPVQTAVKSSSGAGRTMSQRSRKVCTVENIRHLFLHYQERDEVKDLLTRLANAEANTAGFPKDGTIPGVSIKISTSIA